MISEPSELVTSLGLFSKGSGGFHRCDGGGLGGGLGCGLGFGGGEFEMARGCGLGRGWDIIVGLVDEGFP